MTNTVLMIAFYLPPSATGSGHLRPLGFAKHLPSFGWTPIVLSANERAYPHADSASLDLIPEGCRVYRAFALDARRHFGIRGKYPGILAQPDGWASWWPAAVYLGLRLIRRYRVRAIWSTYPIMTGHCVAYTLSRLTGLPWIADFRDPVASSVEAGNPYSAASQHRWEKRVLERATRTVFTTPGAMRDYASRYPEASREGRLAVIPNGYEEAAFSGLSTTGHPQPHRPLRLVHSGFLYREGRNPVPFFKAIANLKAAGALSEADARIVLRASGSEAIYADEIKRRGLDSMITLAPPISNREALLEQSEADALLLFQGGKFDGQIPAKVYEYLRVGRPIFALVGKDGDTAELLRDVGGAELVAPDDVPAIERSFAEFIRAVRDKRAPVANESVVQTYSRNQGAASLAGLLDKIAP